MLLGFLSTVFLSEWWARRQLLSPTPFQLGKGGTIPTPATDWDFLSQGPASPPVDPRSVHTEVGARLAQSLSENWESF